MTINDLKHPKTSILSGAVHPLNAVLKEIDTVRPDLYQTFTIDLGTARTIASQSFDYAGDTLAVETIDGTADIVFSSPDKEIISLNRNRRFAVPFTRFWIINSAQVGKTLKLIIGRDGAFEALPVAPVKLADTQGADINPAEMSTTPVIYNVTMTLADTEYSQALPAGCKKFLLKCQDGTAFRMAFVTGKVAAPTAPYLAVPAGATYSEDNIKATTTITLYVACAAAGKVAEIVAWS